MPTDYLSDGMEMEVAQQGWGYARPARLPGNQIAGGTRSWVHTSSHPVLTLIAAEGKLRGEMVYSEMADCGIVRGPSIGTCQPCFL